MCMPSCHISTYHVRAHDNDRMNELADALRMRTYAFNHDSLCTSFVIAFVAAARCADLESYVTFTSDYVMSSLRADPVDNSLAHSDDTHVPVC